MRLKTLLATAALFAGTAGAAHAQTPPPDSQLAQGALVTVHDFPSGWTESDGSNAIRLGCPGTTHAQSVATGIARSGIIHRGTTRSSANAVYVFADATVAGQEFDGVSKDTPRCYTKALRKTINAATGFHVRSIKTTQLRLAAAADDQRSGVHVRVALTARRQRVVVRTAVHVDLVFVRKGRSVSLALFLREKQPFEKALRTQLTDVQATRLP